MIYLFGVEKGGVGKSTLAINISTLLALSGNKTVLVDMDKQSNAYNWCVRRKETGTLSTFPCIRLTRHHVEEPVGQNLVHRILELQSEYTDIVLDAGGQDSVELRSAMVVCDKQIIPLNASQFDAETIPVMSELVDQVQVANPELDAKVVVTMASTNIHDRETQELIAVVEMFDNLGLIQTVIHNRIAFRRTLKDGRSVIEADPNDYKAANEIKLAFEEITGKEFFHEE